MAAANIRSEWKPCQLAPTQAVMDDNVVRRDEARRKALLQTKLNQDAGRVGAELDARALVDRTAARFENAGLDAKPGKRQGAGEPADPAAGDQDWAAIIQCSPSTSAVTIAPFGSDSVGPRRLS